MRGSTGWVMEGKEIKEEEKGGGGRQLGISTRKGYREGFD